MKRTLLCALLLSGRLLATSQQKAIEMPMDPADAQDLGVYSTPLRGTGNILLTLTSRHTLRHLQLSTDSSAGAPVTLAYLEYNSKEHHFLVAAALPDGIESCIANKDYSLLRFIHSPAGAQTGLQTDSLIIPAGQQVFKAFYQDETFYAVTVQKHANTIYIYRRRPHAGIEIFEKETAIHKWGIIWYHGSKAFTKNFVDNLYDLVRSVGMIQEDSTTPPLLTAMIYRSKCYIRPGMLYLTFDDHHLVTNVIEVPLDDRAGRLLQFKPEDWYHKTVPPGFSTGNSYIFGNTLITAAIIHHQPWLAFYDLHTGKLLQSYAPDEKGNTSFPRSPIWQVGGFWKKDKVHPIKMEDFAVNAFDYWTLGISARKVDSGRIEIGVGTIYNRESFGQMMLILAEASPAVLGAGAVIFIGSSVKPMFFYSQFTNATFKPLPYKELPDKSELIDTFANSQTTSRKRMTGFQHGEDYWLTWYDADQQKYLIYKF